MLARVAALHARRAVSNFSPVVTAAFIAGGMALLVLAGIATLDLRGQLFFGLGCLAICLILGRDRSSYMTMALMGVSIAVSIRYIWWRSTETLHFTDPLAAVLGYGLFGAEVYALAVLALGYFQCVRPLERPIRLLKGPAETWPTVDIFVPTYNESLDIVQDTVLAAATIDYPPDRRRIHLLDDGRRPEFRAFAEQAGVNYITRPDNLHAKAGNLNNALKQTNGELVAVFDADHVATRAFLQMTAGWFQVDPRLALLQTPHYFYSPDPIQRNVFAVKDIPGEGDLFYGVVQPGNDFWNAAFFCGSCAVIRRSALDDVGGFARETVTEDAHTAMRMQKRGWNTAYMNQRVAAGLATERLALHVGQRARWARGMTQIFRAENPLLSGGQLSLAQRLCYLAAMLHFQFALPRIVFLTSPLAYLLFGQQIVSAPALTIAAYAFPHLLVSVLVNERLHGRDRRAFWGEVYETLLAFHLVWPALIPLLDPKRGKFNVTEKGGLLKEGYFDVRILAPLLITAALLTFGMAWGVSRLIHAHSFATEGQTTAINVVWSIFNLMIVLTAISVGRETRQVRTAVRIAAALPAKVTYADGSTDVGVTRDLSMGGAAVVLTKAPAGRKPVSLELPRGVDPIPLPVELAEEGVRGLRLRFSPLTLTQRRELVRVLMGRADAWPAPHEKPQWTAMQSFFDLCRASLSVVMWRKSRAAVRTSATKRHDGMTPTAAAIGALTLGLGVMSAGLSERAEAQVLPVTAQPVASAAGAYHASLSLKDLGQVYPLRLRGVDGEAAVPFDLRSDETVTAATLKLRMAYSPQLLEDLSQMVVTLNDEVIANVQLTAANSAGVTLEIPIDAGLFSTSNRLNVRFVGHYTRDCEDPQHSTLWADVSNVRSTLDLTIQRLGPKFELARLPAPFLNIRDARPQRIVFALPAKPSNLVLQAASASASYFGVQANYRLLRYGVSLNAIPAGDAVVVGKAGDTLGGVVLPAVNGPSLTLTSNPADPFGTLLVVSGRTDQEVLTAARVLSSTPKALSGQSSGVSELALAQRQPYDAPRWLSTDRKARLGDLVDPLALQAAGLRPGVLTADLRMAPDLFFWPKQSARMDLGYRYPRAPWLDYRNSRLDVSINDRFLGAAPLKPESPVEKAQNLIAPGLMGQKTKIDLPAYDLFARNRVGFYYDLRVAKEGACKGEIPGNVHANIDPDSTVDLTGAHHFARLPELSVFASAGFPFSRRADFSESLAVMSTDPTADEIETLLAVVGRAAASTGAPVTALEVAHAGQTLSLGGRDVLVIGPIALSRTLSDLFVGAPVVDNGGQLRVNTSTRMLDRLFTLFGPAAPVVTGATGWEDRIKAARDAQSSLAGSGTFKGLASWISPGDHDRVVVAVMAQQTAALPNLIYDLDEAKPGAVAQGDLSIAGSEGYAAFRVGPSFWSGHLPVWVAGLWAIHNHPLLLTVAVAILALLLSLLVSGALAARARRRLHPDNGDR